MKQEGHNHDNFILNFIPYIITLQHFFTAEVGGADTSLQFSS